MALTVDAPGTPEWWLVRLAGQLNARKDRYQRLANYAVGHHDLPIGHPKAREAFRRFQRKARSNYTGLVAEAPLERLRVTGFRMGADQDEASDRDAQRIWQANHLDANSALVHRAALEQSRGYVIVGPPRGDVPLITAEDPMQVHHESDPTDRRRVRAAVKMWHDDADNRVHAVLYLPDRISYFETAATGKDHQLANPASWRYEDDDAAGLGVVPVVPFVNRQRLNGDGLAEFEDVIDIQDRINHMLLDRMVIGYLQAFRQRWATGVNLEDEDGRAELPFVPGVDLLWATPDEKAKFGDFDEADLRQLLDAVKDDVRDLAAVSRTPPHYLLGDVANLSAEALDAAEAGLVAKVVNRQDAFGEQWEQVIRIAFRYLEDPRADVVDSETLWAPAQRQSVSKLADAAVKEKEAGVPWRQRMERLGFTPAEISRMESQRTQDALLAGLGVQPDEVTGGADAA